VHWPIENVVGTLALSSGISNFPRYLKNFHFSTTFLKIVHPMCLHDKIKGNSNLQSFFDVLHICSQMVLNVTLEEVVLISNRCFLFFQSGRENYQGTEAHQLEIIQGSEGETSEVDISGQPQILITQGTGTGRDEGNSCKHLLDFTFCFMITRLVFYLKAKF